LPDTLPGYLINMTMNLSLDGATIASAPAGTMGSEVFAEYGLWDPDNGWFSSNNPITVGEYTATALDLQGISATQAQNLQTDIETTKAKLESDDLSQLTSLTKHNIVGDLFHATLTSYFALNNVQDQIAARAADVIHYRGPSYGHLKSQLSTQYWFGIPRDVTFAGLLMDIDASKVIVQSKTSDRQEEVNFLKAVGSRYSAMEHLVPEQMFSTEEAPAHGISAVKAIALAAQEGQKVFTITQANLDAALSQIQLEDQVEQEIRSAVYAGHIVTTHEALVDFHGSLTAGYIIEDPTTGAAAYKISGGSNGGGILGSVLAALGWLAVALSGGVDIVKTLLGTLKVVAPFFSILNKLLPGVGALITVLGAINNCKNLKIAAVPAIAFMIAIMVLLGVILPLATFLGPLFLLGIRVVVGALLNQAVDNISKDVCSGV